MCVCMYRCVYYSNICVNTLFQILYDNSGHNGQMLVTLRVQDVPLKCHGIVRYQSEQTFYTTVTHIFNYIFQPNA